MNPYENLLNKINKFSNITYSKIFKENETIPPNIN